MLKCKAGTKSLSIEPNGKILPCCVSSAFLTGIPDRASAMNSNIFQLDSWQHIQKFGATEKICSYCLEQEKTGSYSVRGLMNNLLSDSEKNCVEYLNIYLSNVCSLQCRTCDSSRSYLIGQNRNEASTKAVNDPDYLKKIISEHSHSLRYISFQGGEPFLYPHFLSLLQHINQKHPHIYISVVSNLSHLPDWIIEKCDLIGRIKISVDGIGPAAEFIRKGLVWEKFNAHFKRLCLLPQLKEKIILSFTLSAYSIFQVNEVAAFADKHQIEKIDMNTVINPAYLDVKNLNTSIKKIFLNRTFKIFDKEIRARLGLNAASHASLLTDFNSTLTAKENEKIAILFPDLIDR